uniref:Putative cell division cycle-associated protein 8 n=1 Tax=Culex tarsalis TaxID=7177 RepID=A0A1Q3EVK8_CULTA
MVRTKPSRHGNTKRNRTSFQEEKLNAKIRDFDILADGLLSNLESVYSNNLDDLTRMLRGEKNRMPKRILQMKMGDLRLLTGVRTFADLEKLSVEAVDAMSSIGSSQFSQSFGNDKPGKKLSKADEGYLTEDSGLGCNPLPDVMMSATKSRPYGPLASAMKNRRRSKSVSGQATPSKGHASLLLGIKSKKTFGGSQSLFAADSNRLSRSKFRTPNAAAGRLQTVSTDRGLSLITPKVQPNTPMAILRHARAGESIYSMTGSPVITAAMVEETANVNIPVANGMLSIRPTEMDSIDAGLLQRIDPGTLEHLKKLQMNLNKIMLIAEQRQLQKL